jgi:hypothetical protein
MAFNYDSLKRITSAGIVDRTMTTADLADLSITNAKITNTTVVAGDFAPSAVDVGSSIVTGITPTGKGGTGFNSVGAANTVLTINSANNALVYAPTGLYGMQVFYSSGPWDRPVGVRFIKVQLSGGGGGGSGHGESGGAGGYAERILDVTGIASVGVTIGGEVGGSYYSGAGGNGNASSFGSYLSASAGYGANRNNQHSGGLAGSGSGGEVNIYGGGGQTHHNRSAVGGDSYWGGSVAAGHPQGGNFSHNHQSHSAPGSGGAGAYFNGHLGSNGRPGICVVTMYY